MPENYKTLDSGVVIKNVDLTGVTGIRATCSGTVSSGGGPSWDNTTVGIYEVQATQVAISPSQQEKRYELDIIIDTKHSVLDNLDRMLITCNAALINSLMIEEGSGLPEM